MQIIARSLVLLLILFVFTGCEAGGGKAASIPDSELLTKWSECQGIESPSRIKVMACENYERECARRKKNGGLACN